MLKTAFAAILSIAVAVPALAQEGPDRTLTVTGEGSVTAVPDMVRISVGVMASASDASDAMAQNADAMQRAFEVLDGAGIGEGDRQTGEISLMPQYNHDAPRAENAPPEIMGYVSSSRLDIRVRDISALGGTLDALTGAGINRIDSISFDFQDRGALMEEARKAAVADARARAELYAGAADLSLGPILNLAEGGAAAPPRPVYARAEAMMASDMPIAAGEAELTARVTITWGLD